MKSDEDEIVAIVEIKTTAYQFDVVSIFHLSNESHRDLTVAEAKQARVQKMGNPALTYRIALI